MAMGKQGVVSEILKQKLRSEAERESSPEEVLQEPIKRTSISLPLSLYKGLKALAAVEGIKLNTLMVELLYEGLRKRLKEKDLQKELGL